MQIQVIFLALAIAMVSAQCDSKIKRGQACSETSQCRPNLVCNNWRNGSKLCQPAQCSVKLFFQYAGKAKDVAGTEEVVAKLIQPSIVIRRLAAEVGAQGCKIFQNKTEIK
ncbi:hypothetical protein TCAL_13560 [Tigriopus californicus]|uniref:Saposin A-type domain-containing protein n=1 Tax=Tigriopus californicus TaxID=6832 RepID=A0A553PJB2_TIGCA|nr:hypothetical protein TCAL_13560 [Tigriopus californicus]|eukprot:TCALIF_13560-PA protein Name:"Protein of unknown function" AED:0.16 eAED:0.23 QI:88/0.5/0.66/1/0/0.33/3/0/110